MSKRLSIVVFVLAAMVALAACSGSATPPPASATPSVILSPPPPGPTVPVPTPAPPTITLPADLDLSGQLIFTDSRQGVGRLDLTTAEVTILYRPPEYAFVNSAALAPDGETLVLAYSPPPDPANPAYVAGSVYTLPATGTGEPTRLLADSGGQAFEFAPWWAPDGQAIYYGQYVYPPLEGTPDPGPTGYLLARYPLPEGPAETLLSEALVAGLTADGSQLYYVSIDTDTLLSNIYAADPDGSNARSLLSEGETWIIDSLAIAPDGEHLLFSRANNDAAQSSLPWVAQLLGAQVAEAHSLPSDLWVMQVGEAPVQLTQLADYGFVQAYSPDGQFIVFSCSSGVFVMRADGSGLTSLSSDLDLSSVQWIP